MLKHFEKEITIKEIVKTKLKPYTTNSAIETCLKLVNCNFLKCEKRGGEVESECEEFAPPQIDHLAAPDGNIRLNFEPRKILRASISFSGDVSPKSPRRRSSV